MSGAPQRLIAVVGPTGTGKSDLAVAIAEAHAARGRRAEIVNADAMQLYRGMDIGTAKLTVEERRGIPHHLLDVLDVTEEAAVARYQTEARAVIGRLLEEGVTPVLVGGSGLYVSGVVFDFSFPRTDGVVRERLERELAEQGAGALYARLSALDAEAAHRIGPHNARRIVRALEVAAITGSPSAGMLPETPAYWRPTTLIGLRMDRDELTGRLDARVARMWESGLLDEVAALRERGLERGATASRAIGYAQGLAQLDGRMSEQEAITETRRLTRRYARRQMSWFRRYDDLRWFDVRDRRPAEARRAAVAYAEDADEAAGSRP